MGKRKNGAHSDARLRFVNFPRFCYLVPIRIFVLIRNSYCYEK